MKSTQETLAGLLPFVTAEDLAAVFGVPRRTVERSHQNKKLPVGRVIFGRVRWTRDEILAWLQGLDDERTGMAGTAPTELKEDSAL